MIAYIYIPELDLEVEFEGEVSYFERAEAGSRWQPPTSEHIEWKIWWNTAEYSAEQNSIIDTYLEDAEAEMDRQLEEEAKNHEPWNYND